jgi:hypothetical protein
VFKKTAFLGMNHQKAVYKKPDCTATVLEVVSCGAEPKMMKM